MAEISIFLIIGPVVATFVLLIVWLVYAYIIPTKNSPGWIFMLAKKKRRPVFFLDTGNSWKVTMGRNEGPGFAEDNEGSMINISAGTMKECMGVRIGVGEYNRSITANPMIVKVIDEAKRQKVDAKTIANAMATLEQELPAEQEREEPEHENENTVSEEADKREHPGAEHKTRQD